ncbi:swi5-dependent recombination DNA repair protein 1 homolog [Discoglossus pictus]
MKTMDTPTTQPTSIYNGQNYLGSPDAQSSIATKQPMSATLRERLRKTRRSFSAAFTVAKRLKIDCEENESPARCTMDSLPAQQKECASAPLTSPISVSETCKSEIRSSRTTSKVDITQVDMFQERRRLLKQIEEKEDILRRLKMVKLYRSKNNLTELQSLIAKWRKSSQSLLYELQAALSSENRKISLAELIESYGLDEKLLGYNKTEEDFEDT